MSAVVAAADNDVIGRAGGLPWHLPGDLRHFAKLTRGHVLVAGRLTQASIVERLGRPLDGRITVVATGAASAASAASRAGVAGPAGPAELPELPEFDTVVYRSSVTSALSTARALTRFAGGDEVFVIGGAQVYAQLAGELDRIYLTRVLARVDGDVRLPADFLDGFGLSASEPGPSPAGDQFAYRYDRYDRTAPTIGPAVT